MSRLKSALPQREQVAFTGELMLRRKTDVASPQALHANS
jgi:hypothetical protein